MKYQNEHSGKRTTRTQMNPVKNDELMKSSLAESTYAFRTNESTNPIHSPHRPCRPSRPEFLTLRVETTAELHITSCVRNESRLSSVLRNVEERYCRFVTQLHRSDFEISFEFCPNVVYLRAYRPLKRIEWLASG